MLRLERGQARRIAVRAQLLDAYRPESLVALVDHLTLLQLDPTKAVAPSADLVAWSRLGADYAPTDLRFALEEERSLVEFDGRARPMADIGLFLAGAEEWPPWQRARDWLATNAPFRRDVLDRLADEGPLTAPDIPDTSVVPWQSSGWTNDKNVQRMLDMLQIRGDVAVTARRGRHRVWDLADRVYPDEVSIPSVAEAEQERNRRRLTALGVARERTREMPGERVDVGDTGIEAEIEGVAGRWRIDEDALGEEDFDGRCALLSPLDRLVFDRDRTLELFDYEYVLEMYKPAAQRRWGYYALPILHGDRLVGKLDARADHRAGVLRVNAIHEDVPFTPEVADDVDAEIAQLAAWLGLSVARA
ncbi:winged helix DNA-binding domain-containing protein [Nocardioides panacisoli]|uniref:DNA glycosylase AlkZ-like family protein n=1 Tax=Nocardioides panacisoli TaxID=627624 RepID=UPI001C62762F|nr:crosslink repair DNA glycosylase YcaQ family protein [Nocardioides panacisoli]QYJ04370.1 winged helix DNA-binding domain-containing protein [Nocardioides panacisoli]